MGEISFKIEKIFCEECSQALRRFIGHMDGVESIDVDDGKIIIKFNESKITGEELTRIIQESIEKLGYIVQ